MNEQRIKQVLEIEQQAQAVHEAALNEAKQLPNQAEQEAQMIIEKARADAEAQARDMLAKAQSQEESSRIASEAEEKIRRMDTLAHSNFNRAVADVLCRVVGKE